MTTILTNGNSKSETLTDNNGGFRVFSGSSISLSHGNDSLFTDDSVYVANGGSLDMGTGSDLIDANRHYYSGTLTLGSGHDTLISGDAFFLGTSGLVDMGSGDDTLTINGTASGFVVGGTGYDQFNLPSGQYDIIVTPISPIDYNVTIKGNGVALEIEEFEYLNDIAFSSYHNGSFTVNI